MSTKTLTDAFRLLGVPPDADAATIRTAWRALVRRYHPDQIRDDRAAADRRLADLNAAYDMDSSWQPSTAGRQQKAPRARPPPRRARRPDAATALPDSENSNKFVLKSNELIAIHPRRIILSQRDFINRTPYY